MSHLLTDSVEKRASDLFEAGYRRPAIDVLEAALVDQPEAGELWRMRAVLLYREGRLDEAFHNIQRALLLVPLGAEGMLVLADGYYQRKQRKSATDVLTALAIRDDLPYELWSPLFDGLLRLHLWQAAPRVARRAASERPDDDLAYFSMAHAALCARQPAEQAIHLLQRAIDLNPAEPRYRVTLAVQLLRMRRRREAQACVMALGAAAIESLDCRCCLDKFLRLSIEQGDAACAALLAGRLARLTAGIQARHDAAEEQS